MLMQIGGTLALISVITEVLLVHGSKIVSRLYTKGLGPIKGVYWNTFGSFLLSWLIGKLFAADGLTIAYASAVSTGISQVYFKFEEFIQEKYGYPTVYAYLKANWLMAKEEWNTNWRNKAQEYLVLARNTWKLIIILLKVATFPFWGPVWIKNKIQSTHIPVLHPVTTN